MAFSFMDMEADHRGCFLSAFQFSLDLQLKFKVKSERVTSARIDSLYDCSAIYVDDNSNLKLDET